MTQVSKFDYAALDVETAAEVRADAEVIRGCLEREAVDQATIGARLIHAKATLDRGQWWPWLEAEFEMSVRTAERYMAAARDQRVQNDSAVVLDSDTRSQGQPALTKSARVIQMLKSDSPASDQDIAAAVGVHRTTVGTMRRQLKAGVDPLAKAKGKPKTTLSPEQKEELRDALLGHPAPTVEEIADSLGVSRSMVYSVRAELVADGSLSADRKSRRKVSHQPKPKPAAKQHQPKPAAPGRETRAAAWGGGKLRSLTREQVDPSFETDLRAEYLQEHGREPTETEISNAFQSKHGHVRVTTYDERQTDQLLKASTGLVGNLQAMEKEAVAMEALFAGHSTEWLAPTIEQTFEWVAQTPLGAKRMERAKAAYAGCMRVLERLRPFMEARPAERQTEPPKPLQSAEG